MRQGCRRLGWAIVTTKSLPLEELIDCAFCQSWLLVTAPDSSEVRDWATARVDEMTARAIRIRMLRMYCCGMDGLPKWRCADKKWKLASGGQNLGHFRECHSDGCSCCSNDVYTGGRDLHRLASTLASCLRDARLCGGLLGIPAGTRAPWRRARGAATLDGDCRSRGGSPCRQSVTWLGRTMAFGHGSGSIRPPACAFDIFRWKDHRGRSAWRLDRG